MWNKNACKLWKEKINVDYFLFKTHVNGSVINIKTLSRGEQFEKKIESGDIDNMWFYKLILLNFNYHPNFFIILLFYIRYCYHMLKLYNQFSMLNLRRYLTIIIAIRTVCFIQCQITWYHRTLIEVSNGPVLTRDYD